MKKKLLIALLTLVSITVCAFAFTACNLFGGGTADGDKGQQGVSYGTATVNYHYEYNVAIENYWQEKYSIVSGAVYDMEITYTPPMKAGYRFLGWTREEGGAGEVVGSTYSITGSGFGGTVYNFYAKYEAITFEVVYHLDGGVNHADNPASLTGKQTLKNPTKEKYRFEGWYRDPEFTDYTTAVSMTDDVTTTVNLYAKWIRVYTISYVSDQPKLSVQGDQSYRPHSSFTEDDLEFTVVLQPEYYENYLFLGWEIEAGAELATEETQIRINPKEVNDDLIFTARYLQASNPANTDGLRAYIYYGEYRYYARDIVEKIIVEDIYNKSMINEVVLYYSGEQPPEVVCREGVKVYCIYDPDAVEAMF